jgi:molybdate transport system ATP-binding protein
LYGLRRNQIRCFSPEFKLKKSIFTVLKSGSMDSSFLIVERLCVNINGKEILRDISLTTNKREQWVIFGDAGAGKTVFAQTLAGNHAFQGHIHFSENDASRKEKKVMVVEQHHRFRDLQNQNNFYYQQRYNAFDAESTVTVDEDLSRFEDGIGPISKSEILEIFKLSSSLKKPLIQLSNGEHKRLQILKAFLGVHHLLMLDEPWTGLDEEGRSLLDDILSLLSASGQQLMLLSSRIHIPSCFSYYGRLQNGRLTSVKLENILTKKYAASGKHLKEFPSLITFSYPDFKYAVRMHDVSIRYSDKNILEGINWAMEKGSCWALKGPNGAGKSTLLSLITADNPQAYANEIYLFDRKRGSGESIWEIKQKIGYLSPELQLYFDPSSTAFTAIASGLFDTLGLFRQMNPQQEKLVLQWLEFLECTPYTYRILTSLPAGIQRLIMLGRAMIKMPPLLILDEPCQGLDESQTAFVLQTIDRYCAHFDANLIFVSHYNSDFPACVTKTLKLKEGKIV